MLEVIYLIFNEGYSATAGDDWMRPALCEDALRLGRIVAGLARGAPLAQQVPALVELHLNLGRAYLVAARRDDALRKRQFRIGGGKAEPAVAGD